MGANESGEVGDGSTFDVPVPERIVPPRELVVTNVSLSGTSLVLGGFNEFFGGTAIVLMTTNPAIALSQWTPVWTNGLGSGNFAFTATNAVDPASRERLYILRFLQVR